MTKPTLRSYRKRRWRVLPHMTKRPDYVHRIRFIEFPFRWFIRTPYGR